MAQKHEAKIRITCDLEVPQYQKDRGVEVELRADGALLGEVLISGAHVYFRRTRRSNWKYWSFSQFAKLLEKDNP